MVNEITNPSIINNIRPTNPDNYEKGKEKRLAPKEFVKDFVDKLTGNINDTLICELNAELKNVWDANKLLKDRIQKLEEDSFNTNDSNEWNFFLNIRNNYKVTNLLF
ncbi:MAG: hypothetical protein QWI36_03210 [Wolbachia endosymbiont of Tyrophagus putrescentiae]|nr:hypothetical protein [Wolbachia endosymbiont of Tyrophagus putrescentiae]